MKLIGEMLSYPFLVRAMVGGILISLCAALLGVSLVLKRYSMIGDGLSHVSFGALSVAVAAGWCWWFSTQLTVERPREWSVTLQSRSPGVLLPLLGY